MDAAIGAAPPKLKEHIMNTHLGFTPSSKHSTSRVTMTTFSMFTKTLLSSAALMLASSVASASGHAPARLPNGTVLFQGSNGFPIMMNPGSARQEASHQHQLKLPRGSDAEDDIASDPLAPFISWAGIPTPQPALGYQFTSGKTEIVKEINIALAGVDAQTYGYSAEVDLYTDDNGVPGTKIDGADVTAAETSFGPCCALTAVKLRGKQMLNAGTPYWVIVAPDKDSYVVWQIESTDFVDSQTIATNDGSGWVTSTSQWYVPAVEVK
jgi:hypothetical protein